MCSINHELKAIYIHIPKNGGLYVEEILENSHFISLIRQSLTNIYYSNYLPIKKSIDEFSEYELKIFTPKDFFIHLYYI